MTKYLLLKHYRGVPERLPGTDVPMDQWTPQEIEDHIAFMGTMIEDLQARGEYVDAQALSPQGAFVRYDGDGRPPVTDGPFAETKDLIAGWMAIESTPRNGRTRLRPICPQLRGLAAGRYTSGSRSGRS